MELGTGHPAQQGIRRRRPDRRSPAIVAAPVAWGNYELVAEPASDAGGGASVTFSAGWGAQAVAGSDTPDRLTVALDQPAYRAGDIAQVTVDALADGTGIVSVLSNRVVALRMVALKQGVNTVDLPVTDDWGAGVYVAVSAVRPLAGAAPDDRRPVRALGLAHAAVDPADRQLDATLDAPAQARPRGTVPVVLTVAGAAPGDIVQATIAAVDQGILNLTGFAPPDPTDHYFGQRRLGVALRDLYGRLILPSGAPDGTIRAGGDAALAMNAEAPPPTEALMSWFSGPLTVGADGTLRVDVPVGDFNGALRVMAVAWSDKGVGQADAAVTVSDPVVMTVTAPRFLAPGDVAEIGLLLTHVDGPAGQIAVALADDGDVPLSPAAPPPVALARQAQARLTVPISAADRQGTAKLHLAATLPDGSAVTKDIAIPVTLNAPQVIRQDRLTLAPGAAATVPAALIAGLMPGAAVTLATGDFATLDVAAQLARLARYPYGCTEQLASVAMPLLYLPRLADLTDGRGDADAPQSVDAAIAQILTRQGPGGGFGLWSAGSGDLWLDAYVTDFLSRARAAGHAVPDMPFRAAIVHLQTAANVAVDPQAASADENAALAYALAVLARERAATVGDLRYYADTAAAAFATPMSSALLGSALASYGDQPRADRLFAQAMAQVRRDAGTPEQAAFRADYGTHLRDAAAVLALAADCGIAGGGPHRTCVDPGRKGGAAGRDVLDAGSGVDGAGGRCAGKRHPQRRDAERRAAGRGDGAGRSRVERHRQCRGAAGGPAVDRAWPARDPTCGGREWLCDLAPLLCPGRAAAGPRDGGAGHAHGCRDRGAAAGRRRRPADRDRPPARRVRDRQPAPAARRRHRRP